MSFLSNLLTRWAPTLNGPSALVGGLDRHQKYLRYLRAYSGYSIRGTVGSSVVTEASRLKHNFNKPIVNLGAAFMAAKPLKWKIDNDDEEGTLTKAAFDIWDRSGSDRTLLDASRCAGINGEVVGLATQAADGRPRIEFVSPDIAFPTFDGSDYSKLVALDISWSNQDPDGRQVVHREFYDAGGRTVFLNGDEVPDQSQVWDRIPAAWIRNLSIKGQAFGISDLDGVAELVEEYDHIASKRTRIIDLYANPNIVAEGMEKKDIVRDRETMFFIPLGTKLYYLEWQGNQPDVESQLSRVRNDISEMSQVPAVAFGRQDSGLSAISGIALRILYGPLLAKTNDKWANWSPSLEYLMHLCLQAEGYNVPLEAVNCVPQDPLPTDPLQEAQAAASNVDKGLISRVTAIARLGAEDPGMELERIEHDQRFDRLKQLTDAGVALPAAAMAAGFTPEEAAALTRSDFVPAVGQ